jgi:hypothetical protein
MDFAAILRNVRTCNLSEAVALFLPHLRGINPMNFRTLTPSIALSVLGLALITTAAPAAELALAPAHHREAYVRTGYVFWDDVYPPAVYGPNLRSVEEVAALKAAARPVSQLFWGYWYPR